MHIKKKNLFLITALFFTFAMFFTAKVSAQTKPSIGIEPSELSVGVGDEFTVNITAADWEEPGVFSHELYLYYNTTYLNATDAEIPSDHWLKPTQGPYNIFIVDGGTINNTEGFASFAATLLAPELGKTGGGILAQVTFTVIQGPSTGNITSYLELEDSILVDPNAVQIPPENYDVNPTSVIIPEFSAIAMLIALFTITATIILLKTKRNSLKLSNN